MRACEVPVSQFSGGEAKFEDALEKCASWKAEVGIITYNGLSRYIDRLNGVGWELVIADEAHTIRNPKAKVTESANLLNTDLRYGLSGTPMQNRCYFA